MARLTFEQVAALAIGAGLQGESAAIAVAIAYAESHHDTDAVGDRSLAGQLTPNKREHWGASIGLWQIRSIQERRGTGDPRDASRLTQPAFNASAMAVISGGGRSWRDWGAYNNGNYRGHLARARQAVAAAWGTGRGAGTVPKLGLTHPLRGKGTVSRGFSAGHDALDLAAPCGTAVVAALAGTVVFSQRVGQEGNCGAGHACGGGNVVNITHAGGLVTQYAHLQSIAVGLGSKVRAGQRIGTVGKTGNATGCHLHLGLRRAGVWVDPQPYLKLFSGGRVAEGPLSVAPNPDGSCPPGYSMRYGLPTAPRCWRDDNPFELDPGAALGDIAGAIREATGSIPGLIIGAAVLLTVGVLGYQGVKEILAPRAQS